MEERTKVANKEENNIIAQDVLRAVYALNMCTVSVSQIIDYNDIYILEQEYDAILNNLNLEKMPKADALKNILVELLNTITFFRIQEIRKDSIEKNYQKRIKNAIWSSIPSLNMIVSGNPAAIAFSIATQVGIGYMNYRKEKNNALTEKEKQELELRVTALEQFNALRRQLFTTAWELAEEYQFEDRLRLTEKQIKQYNQILMDRDELRKYVRLEVIQEKFEAFPPFWYQLGHSAAYIAGNNDLPLEEWERELYRSKAKKHFKRYEELNKFNILREDQMTAAFALEYIDLLMLEENPDKKKITELISIADNMSGNTFDVKQLCVIAYLKVGKTDEAARLLMQLVNEDYNTIVNAKLLSRIYVSQFLKGDSKTAKFDYKTLQLRIGIDNSDCLYPMPENKLEDIELQRAFLVDTKIMLQMDFRTAINKFLRKYTVLFNSIIPAPYGYKEFEEYYGYNEKVIRKRVEDMQKILNDGERRSIYLEKLAEVGFRFKYIDLLNDAMEACDELDIWRKSEDHDFDVKSVKANLVQMRPMMKKLQDKMNAKTFSVEDYKVIQRDLSFKSIMGNMLDDLKDVAMETIDSMESMEQIERADYNLSEFCRIQGITLSDTYARSESVAQEIKAYLDYSIFGSDGENEQDRRKCKKTMQELITSAADELIIGKKEEVECLIPGDPKFDLYFENTMLNGGSLKDKTLGILDDYTKKDFDLLMTEREIVFIKRNKIVNSCGYNYVKYIKSSKKRDFIECGGVEEYYNKNVNIGRLYNLFNALAKVAYKNN